MLPWTAWPTVAMPLGQFRHKLPPFAGLSSCEIWARHGPLMVVGLCDVVELTPLHMVSVPR